MKCNASKHNGTLFEQIGLAMIASQGNPFFVDGGYVATSDEDITRWVENDYDLFTQYLKPDGFLKGFGVQGKIHVGNVRIDPDFMKMLDGAIYEFKYQAFSGSLTDKLYKNLLTYQSVSNPSFIVYHGKGFNKNFFDGVDAHRAYLKYPNKTQFLSFSEFCKNVVGIADYDSIFHGVNNISIGKDNITSKKVRNSHSKLKNYTDRFIFDVETGKRLLEFKTIQLLEDSFGDGFRDDYFKKNSFCISE